MRYPATHKDDTRARIVRAASRRFRRDGPQRTAIGDIMTDLRLTHGGFYRHFGGKNELLAEALADAIRTESHRLDAAAHAVPPKRRAAALIDSYLSPAHAADWLGGCPVAAMASDLGRDWEALRRSVFDSAMREHLSRMAAHLPGATAGARVRSAGVLFSGMAGTLAMSRTIHDPDTRAEMLARARQFYKSAIGA